MPSALTVWLNETLVAFYGAVHAQFFASQIARAQYFAYCGYGHSGRDRPERWFVPIIASA